MIRQRRWPEPAVLAGELAAGARARHGLLLCSDFDGTLAPIAPTPDAARPVPAAQEALGWLSRAGAAVGRDADVGVRLAIVTSRDADDLVRHLGLGPEAVVVGCSGLERWVEGKLEIDPAAIPWLPALEDAAAWLETALRDGRVPGARLERKRCGVVLHTRGLPAEADAQALDLARLAASDAGMRVVTGKRAAELRPPVPVDKVDAVRALRHDAWAAAALCVAGDDLPDVEMLAFASSTSAGTAVAVADGETPPAVVDAADVAVDGPSAWGASLAALVNELGGSANR
jgi:trehalose 6-phosphate phosphatase